MSAFFSQFVLVEIILVDTFKTVETFMHNPPDYIRYDKDSMEQVMKKFQDSGAWNLPVIKGNTYYGFVSKSKLLTAYRRELINFTT